MSATRTTLLRATRTAASRHAATTGLRTSGVLSMPARSPFQMQRACYAIPPQDKKDDDLGGPYGQESPNPEQRKSQNRGFAGRAALVIGLGVGFAALVGTFASPRQIANHQIENDTVIGGPNSNTGAALARVKRKEGVKTAHELHQEQTGQTA